MFLKYFHSQGVLLKYFPTGKYYKTIEGPIKYLKWIPCNISDPFVYTCSNHKIIFATYNDKISEEFTQEMNSNFVVGPITKNIITNNNNLDIKPFLGLIDELKCSKIDENIYHHWIKENDHIIEHKLGHYILF